MSFLKERKGKHVVKTLDICQRNRARGKNAMKNKKGKKISKTIEMLNNGSP